MHVLSMENVMKKENAIVNLDGKKMIVVKDSARINAMEMESAHQKGFAFAEEPGVE